jgi:O-antigen ligase
MIKKGSSGGFTSFTGRIREELRQGDVSRWIFYLSLLTVFALPFHIHATRYLIGGLLVVWLVDVLWNRKLVRLLNQRLVWVVILFYALHVLGLFISTNTQKAFVELEHKFTLLLLPVAFASVGVMDPGRRGRVLLAFVAGTFAVSLVSLVAYIIRLSDPGYLEYFLRFPLYNIYTDFSLFNHPTYYALFLELSIVFAFYLLRKPWSPLRKGWLIAIILLFSILVFLASSRSGILSLLVIFFVTIFMYSRRRNWKFFWIGIMLVLGFLATQNYRFGNYMELVGKMAAGEPTDTGELMEKGAMRLVLWDVALDLSQDHLWFGRGTGDVQEALNREYQRRDLEKHMDRNYNPHNQYLSTWMALGLAGLAVLGVLLLWPLILGLRHGDYLAVAFLLLYMSHFMFESMLSRSPGILSFAFFYGLLILNRRKTISQQDS